VLREVGLNVAEGMPSLPAWRVSHPRACASLPFMLAATGATP
jgi:hypothetical protein